MKMKILSFALIALVILVTPMAFAQEPPTREAKAAAEPALNVVETTKAGGNFTTFAKAIETAGLIDTLDDAGPYTIFAPTDEAFAKLPEGTLDGWMNDSEKLKKVLLNHVVSGKVMASDVATMESTNALGGSSLAIKKVGNKVMIGDASIVQADIAASNGVIHAIDTVLIPPES
jgi:uncharacterized surface protein with fasciclin (FAS1) repeats